MLSLLHRRLNRQKMSDETPTPRAGRDTGRRVIYKDTQRDRVRGRGRKSEKYTKRGRVRRRSRKSERYRARDKVRGKKIAAIYREGLSWRWQLERYGKNRKWKNNYLR